MWQQIRSVWFYETERKTSYVSLEAGGLEVPGPRACFLAYIEQVLGSCGHSLMPSPLHLLLTPAPSLYFLPCFGKVLGRQTCFYSLELLGSVLSRFKVLNYFK